MSAGYGSFQALFDVSLEVKAGESVAVIGPNGAGKTTLLRAISKLIDITAGEVSMEGRSLRRVPAHEVIAHGISQVPENRRLFPRLTVEENLRMGAFPGFCQKIDSWKEEILSSICFQDWKNGETSSPARSRAASSRCAPSAAR